jgi:hypothetical protein
MLPYHWNDISQMVNENYAHEYEPNDLLIMAVHHHHSIEKIKISHIQKEEFQQLLFVQFETGLFAKYAFGSHQSPLYWPVECNN